MSAAALLRRLRRDARGATVIEFAVLMPVMAMMIMGLGELSYQVWAQAIVDGAVQKSARDSAIQGGANQTKALDDKVLAQTKQIANNATYSSTRKSYQNFTDVKPENFTDSNGNGKRDAKECFEDVNGNKAWDADPGSTGQGGANDVTLYTFNLTYKRIFPVMGLFGWSNQVTLTSSTLLKNQPYASQSIIEKQTICT